MRSAQRRSRGLKKETASLSQSSAIRAIPSSRDQGPSSSAARRAAAIDHPSERRRADSQFGCKHKDRKKGRLAAGPFTTVAVSFSGLAGRRGLSRSAELAAIRAGAGQASKAETHHDPSRRLRDGRGDHTGLEQIGERVGAPRAAEIAVNASGAGYFKDVLQRDQIGGVRVKDVVCVSV